MKRLEATGYEIKRGKYISVRALADGLRPGQERFTRTKTLGVDYTEDAITKRIAGDYVLAAPPAQQADNAIDFAAPDMQGMDSGDILATPEAGSADIDIDIFATPAKDITAAKVAASSTYTRPAPAVNLIKDIENCVKAQQSAGFGQGN